MLHFIETILVNSSWVVFAFYHHIVITVILTEMEIKYDLILADLSLLFDCNLTTRLNAVKSLSCPLLRRS